MLQALNRPLTEVQTLATTPGVPALMQRYEEDGKEYIFLKGVASTVAGSWVTFDENGVTALLAANAVGPVAVALAASDATTEGGWYQIYGKATGRCLVSCADGADLYATATAGAADDAVVVGDRIHGAICRETEGGTGTDNLDVQLFYPKVDNIAD